MTSPEFQVVVEYLRGTYKTSKASQSAPEIRAAMEAMMATSASIDGVSCEPVNAGGISAEWVTPDSGSSDHALLYLHGGGYVIGSINTHRALAARIAVQLGAPVLLVDYRLAPEHPHPAALSDATTAYRWLLDQGFDAPDLAIAGDSAGGGLTMATLLKLRDDGVALPATAVGISPWLDIAMTGESMQTMADADPLIDPAGLKRMADWFADGADKTQPYMSPLYGDLAGLPPLLVHVGDVETLLDDSTRFAARASAAGVDVTLEVYPEMVHVWHAFGDVPESVAAVARVAEFINKQWADQQR